MNEPRRLLDEAGSDIERALLQAGSRYSCPEWQRERVLAGLGLLGAAGIGSTVASWSLRRALDLGAAKWVTGVSVVGLAAAVPLGIAAWSESGQGHAVARIRGGLGSVELPTLTSTATSAVDGIEAEQGPGPRAAIPGASERRTVRKASSVRRGLAEELEALDEARGLLATGQGSAALARLAQYSAEHPRGRLGLEAEVLRIDALYALGRQAQAKNRAEAFLQRHPHSVLAARVRRHLGE